MGALAPLDNALSAVRFQLVQRDPTGGIVVAEIDRQTLAAAGEWPWPRERFAIAINHLLGAGANLIGFDVDFSARSDNDSDASLQSAIAAAAGKIVLPTFVQSGSEKETTPLAAISEDAILAGVNVQLDPDGRVRRYWRGFQHSASYRASMASTLAGAPYGDSTHFLVDFGIRADKIDKISFEDIYTGRFNPARVRGKTILIGATALELRDNFTTPLRPATPGVMVHALAYESLKQGRALLAPSNPVVLAIAVLALLLTWPRRAPFHLTRELVRHGAVAAVVLLAPIALQAAVPVSVSVGLALFAQAISIAVGIRRELSRRTEELIRQREAHLAFVAIHDPETQLPNRRALTEEIGRQIASATGGAVMVMVIGIERFPILRGAIGYAEANKVVCSLADLIGSWLGQEQVFHISTSMLGVVMRCDTAADARATCEALLTSLETTARFDGKEIDTHVRLGVAIDASPAVAPEKLLEQASIAIDQARIQNRRLLVFNEQEMIDPALQLTMVADVAKGLSLGQFSLVYQAKVGCSDGKIVGAEVLVRWRHPLHGLIPPSLFIPVTEETGAIDDVTRWVLDRAIADRPVMSAAGLDIPISINVSGRLLSDQAFARHVIETVTRSGAHIYAEITETAIIADPEAAIASVAAWRSAGVRISVDDYGSGLSSLSYLKQLAADELKIDRSLVVACPRSARDRLILKSTIDLAHGLGMSVVAEGVEDELVRVLLASMGCDQVQGYRFSRPAPLDDFLQTWRPAADDEAVVEKRKLSP